MKKLATLLVAIVPYCLSAQNIWVADNNPNAPTGSHIFATVQGAVDAASAGDIVQVQPSPYTYGSAIIDKQITLVGIGFNLTKDLPLQSSMDDITLTNNADNTSDADGTIIKGLAFDLLYVAANTGPSFTLENVTVYNCRFNYMYSYSSGYSPVDGFEIYNCYTFNTTNGLTFAAQTSNVLVRNNLIMGAIEFSSAAVGTSNDVTNNILYGGIYVNAEGTNMTIRNNDFVGASGTEAAFNSELKDCIVSNNIFYGSTPSISDAGSTSTNFQRNVFTNNVVHSTGDNTMPPSGGGVGNTGSGNIVASPNFVFVEILNTWSSGYDYSLNTGSPALAPAGSDNSDIGITGGYSPWTDTNLILKTTAIPTIETLNTSTIINPGDDLPVHVKSDSH